jgi:hypothetical protein
MKINPIGHLVKTNPIQSQFKANSKPIKANLPDAQMSVNSILTKDYERNELLAENWSSLALSCGLDFILQKLSAITLEPYST